MLRLKKLVNLGRWTIVHVLARPIRPRGDAISSRAERVGGAYTPLVLGFSCFGVVVSGKPLFVADEPLLKILTRGAELRELGDWRRGGLGLLSTIGILTAGTGATGIVPLLSMLFASSRRASKPSERTNSVGLPRDL